MFPGFLVRSFYSRSSVLGLGAIEAKKFAPPLCRRSRNPRKGDAWDHQFEQILFRQHVSFALLKALGLAGTSKRASEIERQSR